MPRALRSLRNVDYTDRELLHILNDVGDAEGWSTTDDLAEQIRISHPEGNGSIPEAIRLRHAKHCIATRFAWMVRFLWVERDESRTKWRLTEIGRDLMNGALSKRVEQSLDRMKPADRILVMRSLATGFERGAPASTMLRREWEHGTGRR